jgi:hypothetical protein
VSLRGVRVGGNDDEMVFGHEAIITAPGVPGIGTARSAAGRDHVNAARENRVRLGICHVREAQVPYRRSARAEGRTR